MKEFLSKALHAERMRFRGRVTPGDVTLFIIFTGNTNTAW